MLYNLQEWANENKPSKEMIWEGAFWDQIIFVRDTLCRLLMECERADGDTLFNTYENLPKVISTHTSKSIVCPVYYISWHDFIFVMRYNYFVWNVSVMAPYSLKHIDFEDIFEIDEEIHSVYCGGMGEYTFSSFLKNSAQFTIELQNKNEMYFFFRKIWYDLRKKEKESASISQVLKELKKIVPKDLIGYDKEFLVGYLQKTIDEKEKDKSKIQSWDTLNTRFSLSLRHSNKELDKDLKKAIYRHTFNTIPEWLEKEQA